MTGKIGFRDIRIDEIGQIVTGNTPPKKIKEYYSDDFTWIKPTDIEIGRRYVEETAEKHSVIQSQEYGKTKQYSY